MVFFKKKSKIVIWGEAYSAVQRTVDRLNWASYSDFYKGVYSATTPGGSTIMCSINSAKRELPITRENSTIMYFKLSNPDSMKKIGKIVNGSAVYVIVDCTGTPLDAAVKMALKRSLDYLGLESEPTVQARITKAGVTEFIETLSTLCCDCAAFGEHRIGVSISISDLSAFLNLVLDTVAGSSCLVRGVYLDSEYIGVPSFLYKIIGQKVVNESGLPNLIYSGYHYRRRLYLEFFLFVYVFIFSFIAYHDSTVANQNTFKVSSCSDYSELKEWAKDVARSINRVSKRPLLIPLYFRGLDRSELDKLADDVIFVLSEKLADLEKSEEPVHVKIPKAIFLERVASGFARHDKNTINALIGSLGTNEESYKKDDEVHISNRLETFVLSSISADRKSALANVEERVKTFIGFLMDSHFDNLYKYSTSVYHGKVNIESPTLMERTLTTTKERISQEFKNTPIRVIEDLINSNQGLNKPWFSDVLHQEVDLGYQRNVTNRFKHWECLSVMEKSNKTYYVVNESLNKLSTVLDRVKKLSDDLIASKPENITRSPDAVSISRNTVDSYFSCWTDCNTIVKSMPVEFQPILSHFFKWIASDAANFSYSSNWVTHLDSAQSLSMLLNMLDSPYGSEVYQSTMNDLKGAIINFHKSSTDVIDLLVGNNEVKSFDSPSRIMLDLYTEKTTETKGAGLSDKEIGEEVIRLICRLLVKNTVMVKNISNINKHVKNLFPEIHGELTKWVDLNQIDLKNDQLVKFFESPSKENVDAISHPAAKELAKRVWDRIIEQVKLFYNSNKAVGHKPSDSYEFLNRLLAAMKVNYLLSELNPSLKQRKLSTRSFISVVQGIQEGRFTLKQVSTNPDIPLVIFSPSANKRRLQSKYFGSSHTETWTTPEPMKKSCNHSAYYQPVLIQVNGDADVLKIDIGKNRSQLLSSPLTIDLLYNSEQTVPLNNVVNRFNLKMVKEGFMLSGLMKIYGSDNRITANEQPVEYLFVTADGELPEGWEECIADGGDVSDVLNAILLEIVSSNKRAFDVL